MCTKFTARICIIIALLLGGSVSAQEKQDFEAAKKHFKSGQQAMNEGQFANAVREFNKAFEITKDGLVMGQIALAFEKAGDFEAALEAIKSYQRALPEADRSSVDSIIAKYEQAIKEGKSQKLVLSVSEETPSENALKKEDTAPIEDEDADEISGHERFWTWIAAGGAGALALSALVVGLNAQSKYDELESTCAPACLQSDVDAVKTRAITADILWGAAAGAAVIATVLYFFEKPSANEAPDDETDESLVKRLHIAPVVGAGTFGLGANLRY